MTGSVSKGSMELWKLKHGGRASAEEEKSFRPFIIPSVDSKKPYFKF